MGSSQFTRVAFGTTPTPIDLGGAKQVAFRASTNSCLISNDLSFNNYFTLEDGGGAYNATIILNVCSQRLWVKGGGAGYLEIWEVS